MFTSPSFLGGWKNLVIFHWFTGFTMSRTQDLEKSANKFLDDSVRDPKGPKGSAMLAAAARCKMQFFREKKNHGQSESVSYWNGNLAISWICFVSPNFRHANYFSICDWLVLFRDVAICGWLNRHITGRWSLSSSRSLCSRVSRERSKVPQTRRTTARLAANFVASCCPKAPLSSTAIKKLQFPTLQGRNPPFGNYIPDIQVPKGHVSSFPACKYMRSSTTGMRMNMSRLLQQKKALERGLAESLGCSDFLADSVGSLRTPWENDDPSRV